MELSQIFKKYNEYPDFLGIEITNVNQKGSIDDAIIHIAARNNQMQDIVDLVINGAYIDLQGDLGYTALHYACMRGYTDVVQLLLKLGANKNIKNEFGEDSKDINRNASHQNKEEIFKLLNK